MYNDMESAEWFVTKVRDSKTYAQNLYAAMCNMRWQKVDVMPIIKDEFWTCSWRSAGSVVATLRDSGDYLDWYCSGMGGLAGYDEHEDEAVNDRGYVPESVVTDEIRKDFAALGWHPSPWPKGED